MPNSDPTINFGNFRGLNNQQPPERLTPEDLRIANNVDIDNSGRVSRAKGYVLAKAGAFHSLKSFDNGGRAYIANQGTGYLCDLDPGLNLSNLTTLSDARSRISYAKAFDSVYYTNGTDTGRIDGSGAWHEWPKKRPALAPILTTTEGSLKAGKYSVAVTFAGDNGLETPPAYSSQTRLDDYGGLVLTGIPTSGDADLPYTNIYCTNASGENYYYVASVVDSTPVKIQQGFFTVPLRTLHLDEMPSGDMLCFHEERLFVARGQYLFYSEQHNYEHCRLTENLFAFESDVTVLESTPGGLWVVADKTYFLQGTRPEQMSRITKAETGDGFAFSSIQIDSSALKIEGLNGKSAMWCTKHGVCVGTSDGGYFNMTSGRYSPPIVDESTAMHRFEDGIHQYMLFGRDTGGTREGYYIGDRAEAEVWRAGVRVQ